MMKPNDFFKTTTPEQRARILWQRKMLARQGYYPWGKPPLGFSKTRTQGMSTGLPTLITNADGQAVSRMFPMILNAEIKSKLEAASYLIAETGLRLTTSRLMAILTNPNFKGMLKCDQGWVQGKYPAPVTAEVFNQVQSILAAWKGQR